MFQMKADRELLADVVVSLTRLGSTLSLMFFRVSHLINNAIFIRMYLENECGGREYLFSCVERIVFIFVPVLILTTCISRGTIF
jgi:hypothetical protein